MTSRLSSRTDGSELTSTYNSAIPEESQPILDKSLEHPRKEKLPDLKQRGGDDTYAQHGARPPSQIHEHADGKSVEVKPYYNDGINLHASDETPREHRGLAAVHSTHNKRRDMSQVQQKWPNPGKHLYRLMIDNRIFWTDQANAVAVPVSAV